MTCKFNTEFMKDAVRVKPCYYCGSIHPVIKYKNFPKFFGLVDNWTYEIYCDHNAEDADASGDVWEWYQIHKMAAQGRGGSEVGYYGGAVSPRAYGTTRKEAIRNYNDIQRGGRAFLNKYKCTNKVERL